MAAEKKKKSDKGFTFEEGCKRLEEIVAQLSGGEVTLEKNIELYKEGSEILNACNEMLEQAKGVIKVVDKD
ncbi:MAG TPA: exodeoxyribonuclease VII small subunit [Candidatus Limousia pullorum]|uniref:Exodeoxyribonuclease 7 small subunit n=1 Tax=Candidatus Limousia pullorum TaxID=2840860 RepID=A0A9D1LZ92_9FIRM|nr:exodeoxyribonuclease VII small subunit [Anaeromassilibacillus sp. An172]MEE0762537.1 exodeoxyribonuclease VII small subunit [Acutalibacteraceae bacterium]HIU50746.1 exodeoxyribonuclease VII small subunit [Candidatus Limousia pullorum]